MHSNPPRPPALVALTLEASTELRPETMLSATGVVTRVEHTWTRGYTVESGEAATADDYQFASFPLNVSGTAFAVVGACSDPAHGVIWGVAVYIITTIAMRDADFNRLVKQYARYLQPPKA